jgi:MFS family permease
VSGYGIVYAVLLVFGGRLGDRYGRRVTAQAGVVGFTFASLVCGLAPDIETLVAARVAQGMAAALVLPQVLSIIQSSLAEPARTRAISSYGAIGGLSIAVGQLLGGLFVWTDLAGLGWRPIFLVNVPLGVLAVIGTRLWVPETRASRPAKADLGGTLLFGIAALALMIALGIGQQAGWPLWIWALVVLAGVATCVLWRHEQRVEQAGSVPLIAPSLLGIPAVRRGLLVQASGFTAFGGFMFVFSLAMQDGAGMSAGESGLALAPMAVGQMLAAARAPKLIARHGTRVLRISGIVYVCGLFCVIASTVLSWPHPRFYELACGTLVIGAGNGLFVPIVFRTVLAAVPGDQAGVGSGIVTTTQRTTLAVGVALLGAVYVSVSEEGGARLGFVVVSAVFLAAGTVYALFGGLLEEGKV